MPTPSDFPPRWFPLAFRNANSEAEAYYNTKARFFGADAGRQSYKTELLKRRLVMSLIEPKPWSDPRYFYGAPTQAQAKFIAWEDLKALVPKRWIRDPDRDIRESELMIRTGFGSELHVIGMDKPHRIEGKSWDGGGLDECSDLRWHEAEVAIMPMLAPRKGWLGRIGVPKRAGVGAAHFRKFCDDARKSDDPETAAFSWPSSDVMTGDQLKWYQEHWDIKDYDEQMGGQWQEGGGILFHAYSKENKVACSFDPEAVLIITCDFNVNPMSWILGHPRDGGRYVEWFDEIWERDTNTPAVLDILWERYGCRTNGTMEFYGDAASRQRRTSASLSDYQHIVADKRFKEKGATVHFPMGNPPVADRIAASNAVLKNAAGHVRTFIDPRVKHLLSDLENQGFKKGSNQPAEGGDVGHAGAAFGYYVYLRFPIEVEEQSDAPIIIHKGSSTHARAVIGGRNKTKLGVKKKDKRAKPRRRSYARR